MPGRSCRYGAGGARPAVPRRPLDNRASAAIRFPTTATVGPPPIVAGRVGRAPLRPRPGPVSHPPTLPNSPGTHCRDETEADALHPRRLLADLPGLPRDPADDEPDGPTDAGGLRDLPRPAQSDPRPQARLPG